MFVVSEMKRDIGRKSRFLYPPPFYITSPGEWLWIFFVFFIHNRGKSLAWGWNRFCKSFLFTVLASRHWQTERRTEIIKAISIAERLYVTLVKMTTVGSEVYELSRSETACMKNVETIRRCSWCFEEIRLPRATRVIGVTSHGFNHWL